MVYVFTAALADEAEPKPNARAAAVTTASEL